jgi:hypothetical protein
MHDVRRLEIAMDNALLMCFLESPRNFGRNLQNLLNGQRP